MLRIVAGYRPEIVAASRTADRAHVAARVGLAGHDRGGRHAPQCGAHRTADRAGRHRPALTEPSDKPIRILALFAPGANDITARIVADKPKNVLGGTVLVELDDAMVKVVMPLIKKLGIKAE